MLLFLLGMRASQWGGDCDAQRQVQQQLSKGMKGAAVNARKRVALRRLCHLSRASVPRAATLCRR